MSRRVTKEGSKSVKDLMNMSITEFRSFTFNELKAVTQQLVNTANKRLKRLEKTPHGTNAPAYQQAVRKTGKKTEPRFSVSNAELAKTKSRGSKRKNTDLQKLQHKFVEVRDFLRTETSSLVGWKKLEKEVSKRLGYEMSEYQSKKFWRAYRKVEERNPAEIRNLGSNVIQKSLATSYLGGNKRVSVDGLVDRFEDVMKIEYEMEEERLQKQTDDEFSGKNYF